MKIISWNCRGKFRKKYHLLQKLNADIYVIQECENPDKYLEEFRDFFHEYFWCGENNNKGLCVFVSPNMRAKHNDWKTYCLRHFLSLRINDSFDLLGVWACSPYIEEYFIYQTINFEKYDSNTVIIGDFNSNVIWDRSHGSRNHSEVVKQLETKGLISVYHYITGVLQGEEKSNTFYLYKHTDKSYHIDHCFASKDYIMDYVIYDNTEWLQYSDHMPIEVTLTF